MKIKTRIKCGDNGSGLGGGGTPFGSRRRHGRGRKIG